MAALSIPEELAETIRSVVEADSVTEEERAGLDAAFVHVDSVKVLRREMDRRGQKLVVSFQGSRLVYPERIKATKIDPEVEKRRAFLRTKEEERSYNKMVFGLEQAPQESFAQQYSSFQNQASIAVNMIVAIFATFGMGYYISSTMGFNKTECMTIGLIAATAVMIIEMLVFIMRALQMETCEESPSKKRKPQTKKQGRGGTHTSLTPATDNKKQD
ncbi:endoplasmic reticulum-based factor for assembly of V-ATPase-domain-containing protein [Ochromonadaceae sp. CCMP2298]|nr:endoplasmic reticulum-based factor for assembly of V-ATPase-domain-containing protein [Ochromonadaceae sp. CCMP2298]